REASTRESGALGTDERAPADAPGRADARGGPTGPGAKPKVSERRASTRAEDPELAARFARYQAELGIPLEQADVLTASRGMSDLFEEAVGVHADAPAVAGWVVTDLRGQMEDLAVEDLPFRGAALGRLAALVAEGRVSRRAAKDILGRMMAGGGEPAELLASMGLEKLTDSGELEEVVDRVLSEWPEKVDEYRSGNANLLGLFVGQVMKATKGAADPRATRALLTARLDDPA